MSNKVGVEHQPDMMLWSINPSLFIPDHQHNSADFLYNSSSRWSFQVFLVCLYQIATLEKMLTFSNHWQDVTLRYYHHSHGKSTLVDGKTLQSFLIHAIILLILHGKTIPKPRFLGWQLLVWEVALPIVESTKRHLVHFTDFAFVGPPMGRTWNACTRVNSLCYLTYHNLPSLKPT